MLAMVCRLRWEPVVKAGSQTAIDNYRTISETCFYSQV